MQTPEFYFTKNVAIEKCHGASKIKRIHPLGSMNALIKFYFSIQNVHFEISFLQVEIPA